MSDDHCVCKLDEDGNVVELCVEHQHMLDAAIFAERLACASIAEEWGLRKAQLTDNAFMPGADHGERFASAGIAAAIRARATVEDHK